MRGGSARANVTCRGKSRGRNRTGMVVKESVLSRERIVVGHKLQENAIHRLALEAVEVHLFLGLGRRRR